MDFKTYIENFKDEANKIDVQKEIPMVYFVYETAKIQFENAEFESEKIETRKKIEDLIIGNKKRIYNSINNKAYKVKYTGFVPIFLIEIKMHLMYSDLLNGSQNNIEEEKFDAKVYALSYFLDCTLTGAKRPTPNSTLEADLYKLYNEKKAGSTIRKNLDQVRKDLYKIEEKEVIFIEDYFFETIEKENWREILLKLSKHPKKLDEWLKSKQI